MSQLYRLETTNINGEKIETLLSLMLPAVISHVSPVSEEISIILRFAMITFLNKLSHKEI